MRAVGHEFSSLVALLLIVSPAASIAPHTGDGHDRTQARSGEKSMLWQARSNECALGNNPPPGTNCSQ